MNIAIFLTVRYNSTRLPGKCMLTVRGTPTIKQLMNRMGRHIKVPVYMCATNADEDRKYLKPIAHSNYIGYDEAPAGNVIKQHYDCAVKNDIDVIINCDGDDIAMPVEVFVGMYGTILDHPEADVWYTTGNPEGMNLIAYRTMAIRDIAYGSNTNWGAAIKSLPNKHVIEFPKTDPLRLTLDYAEDFVVLSQLLDNVFPIDSVDTVIRYFREHPEIAAINKCCVEKYEENLRKGEST